LSESTLNAIETGTNKTVADINTKYKSGDYISWENKKFFFRSSYEFDYANILDE